MKILAISGSLRKESFNTILLKEAIDLAPEGVSIEIADISTLPLYNQDLETDFPAEVTRLKEQIKAADGIIIATPEYNRSIPGVLKNAIDWTSRPYGQNSWSDKPVVTVGVTVGPTGTAVGQYHLKQILAYLNTHILGQPEFYVSVASQKFAEGVLHDQQTKDFLKALLVAFVAHTKRFETVA